MDRLFQIVYSQTNKGTTDTITIVRILLCKSASAREELVLRDISIVVTLSPSLWPHQIQLPI